MAALKQCRFLKCTPSTFLSHGTSYPRHPIGMIFRKYTSVEQDSFSMKKDNTRKDGSTQEPVVDQNPLQPHMPNEEDCCGEGCENCVWLKYVISVKFHHANNSAKIQEAINCVPSPVIRTFVEMQLKHIEEM